MNPTLENTLVLIPSRGGSKGVPNKNKKPFAKGKSLVERTIETALSVFDPKKIVLSTDDKEILTQGLTYSISLIERDPLLASDSAGMYEVMLDAINKFPHNEFLLLLQPTSPMRTKQHIISALNLFAEGDEAVVSMNEPKGHPFYTLFEVNGEYATKWNKNEIIRRQDLPNMYDVNGLIYLFRISSLKEKTWTSFQTIRPLIVGFNEAIDIDTQDDWLFAEALYTLSKNEL
jgi:N-acylneuraminate cytidylyltransferase